MTPSRLVFRLAVTLLACALLPRVGHSAAILMPAGSTTWMHFTSNVCPVADASHCIASNQHGPNPPNGIPQTTFTFSSKSSTVYGEILPERVRTLMSTDYTGFLYASFQDTYTVHGSAAGSFPVTVTLSASGIARSRLHLPNVHALGSGGLSIEIGTFDPSTAQINESGRVVAFAPSTTTNPLLISSAIIQSAPFTLPISGSVSHTLSTGVADVFTLAYGVNSSLVVGEIDLRESGVEIDFILPEGVWITSEKGGVWGDAPAPAVPVGPWVAIGSALGLLGGAIRGLRPARAASASGHTAAR